MAAMMVVMIMRFMRGAPFGSAFSSPMAHGARETKKELQRLQIDIAKLDTFVVALEADVAVLAQDAGMLLGMLLLVVREIGIHQSLAVVDNGDLPALGDDGHLVPFADGSIVDFFGRHDVVDGPGFLPILQ